MFKKPHNKYLYLILIFLFIFLLIKKHFKSYDQLGILKGEHFLTKSLYYEGYFIGGVRLVQSLPDKKVAIFGQKDGVILNVKNNTLKAAVAFQRKAVLKPEIVDVENDGRFEIMLRGSGYGDVGLLDYNGKTLWIYKPDKKLPSKSMVSGDLDRDGRLEFYAATHNGLHRLDYKGRKIWEVEVENRMDSVAVYDPGKNGVPLVITICFNGQIQFRNCNGQLVREIKPKIKFRDLQLINWPTSGHILAKSGKSIYILDFNGKTIFKYTPKYGFNNFCGTGVKLSDNQNPYLAVITAARSRTFRQLLSIFSPDGKLVYQEVLKKGPTLCTISSDSSKSEHLLVGDGTGNVWEYRLNTK